MKAITSDQYPAKVKRPAWSVLSKDKIKGEFGIEPPEWKESLRKFLAKQSDRGAVEVIDMVDLNIKMVREAFKGCTWGNTTESADDWMRSVEGDDDNAKNRLFKKIFLESGNASLIPSLFDPQIRSGHICGTSNKPFHRSHVERRRKVWRFLYFGERVPIPELDWVVRK